MYDAGAGEPRLDGTAQRRITDAFPAVAPKLVGAEAVLATVAWGTDTVTRLPDTARASAMAVVEFTAVMAVTAKVDDTTPDVGDTVMESPPE